MIVHAQVPEFPQVHDPWKDPDSDQTVHPEAVYFLGAV